MKIIFTKSNIIGSKLIRCMTGESVSHVAFLFDDKIVIHSSLFGVDIKWFNDYKKHNDIVYTIDVALSLEREEQAWQTILNKWDHAAYDYIAILKFGLSLVLNKFGIKKEFQDTNKDAHMCVELYEKVQEVIPELPKILFLNRRTPGQLYDLVSGYK